MMTVSDMTIGRHYRFKHAEQHRLVYLGKNWSGNGYWHQFSRLDLPDCPVWAEITDKELHLIEDWKDD